MVAPVVPEELPRFDRADGAAKVTGDGRYAADMSLTGMAFAAFRYAEVPHARLISVDTSFAATMPGVVAVLTADDMPHVRYSPVVPDRTLFATGTIRYEGEILAAVAAMTPAQATAAAAAIVVRYDELEPVVDLEEAITPESALVHEDWESYEVTGDTVRDRNVCSFSSITKGDVEVGIAQADHVITSRYQADASHAVPIEPRAILAQWQGDKVTIWSSTQVPFDARAGVCQTLGMATNKVRIVVPHLGGGFGGKCGFHFEAHIAALARAARRPVKLVFTRREEFLAPDRRREGMIVELTTGVRADGTIAARTGRLLIDNGAYAADAAFFPQLAAMHAAGPYKIDHVHIEASLIYTNRQPSGSVRAPTAPQACWALESHTDEIARTLGMEPVAFRKLNGVAEGDTGAAGQVYDAIGLQACIDAAVENATPAADLGPDEAIGIAIGWWPSFPGASGAIVRIDDDGCGQIVTGAQECGTGAVMTLRNLAAQELGMEPADFEIIYQDTAAGPYDTGATGSQTLINNGRAVVGASQRIAQQLRELAAASLEADPDDIVLEAGSAHVAGTPAKSVSITELAAIAAGDQLLMATGSERPPPYPELATNCVGDQGVAAWAGPQFSCHAAHVRVDRETGVVRVLDISAAHDSGTILNPLGALGQIEGGIMMGIGQALTEGTTYDDAGRQQNPGLLEYKLQTAADAPTVRTCFIEPGGEGAGPQGAKGLAEAPNVATAAAISNAIAQVIGQPVRALPMTAERVWATSAQYEQHRPGGNP